MFRSRAVFAIGAIGGNTTPDTVNETDDNEVEGGRTDDDHALTAKPHGQGAAGSSSDKHFLSDKPMQKRILRKVQKM